MRHTSRAAAVTGAGPVGRAGRGRLAPPGGGLRAVQQQVLRSFATTGRPPAAPALAETAVHYGQTAAAVLAELHAADFLQLGPGGEIRAAYPFSAVPAPHLVDIDGGPRVHAMCAVDALGIAAMLGKRVRITSADPRTGEPVTVTVQPSGTKARWQPAAAVVFSGRDASCQPCGPEQDAPEAPAAEVSCGYVNFFTSRASAARWASAHPGVTGQILSQGAALHVGTQIFGHLLTSAR